LNSGSECVRVSCWKSRWLNQVIWHGKSADHESASLVQEAIDYCRSHLRTSQAGSSDSMGDEKISDAARAILEGGDSGEEEECDDEVDGSPSKSPSNRTLRCPTSWACIPSDHGPITVKCMPRGNVLLVEATESSLTAFIHLVMAFKTRRKVSKGRVLFSSGSGTLSGGIVPSVYLKPEEHSKISFDFRKMSWIIKYQPTAKVTTKNRI
jgi:hypothetical protein